LPAPTLENKLNDLSTSMKNSARLVQEVSAELEVRAATAERLKEEAATAEALAEMNKAQADAVRKLVNSEMGAASRKIRRDAIRIGVLSFVFGGGVSLLITLLVHPLH